MESPYRTSSWILAGVVVGAVVAIVVTRHFAAHPMDGPVLPEVENSVGMKFVRIPGGSFVMGSPASEADRQDDEDQHDVAISGFCLGKYEVTQQQFERVMGFNASAIKGDMLHPVENVSWDEAVEFCRRLSELPEEKAAGRSYRLPTEAEWEYACRAGTANSAFSAGPNLDESQANINIGDYDPPPTRRVGRYPANTWGLHDMHGNVWEWCQDWYERDYYQHSPRQDPRGPDSGEKRVVRGGSRASLAVDCRTANRVALPPDVRLGNGLRVVLVEREAP